MTDTFKQILKININISYNKYMQELRQEAEIRVKSKSKVGTVHNHSLNYPKDIPAFDSSNIPIRASSIKSEIKASIVPDILGTKKAF